MASRSGANAEGARWALYVIRVGRRLADSGRLLEATSGLALSRLGAEWVEASLGDPRWTVPEVAWLQAQLEALETAAPTAPIADADALPAAQRDPLVAGHARARTAEREALGQLVQRCHAIAQEVADQ